MHEASVITHAGITLRTLPGLVRFVLRCAVADAPLASLPLDPTRGTLLAQLQPNLRYVGQSRQIDDLAKGEICLALTYTGDAGMAAARASEVQQPFSVVYRIPREGTLIWFDTLAIPVDAPHPEAARAFID